MLCGLLTSTGVAGRPESYFRSQDAYTRARQWDIVAASGAFDYADFLRSARREGTTDNGVFAARLMWGTLDELVDKLRRRFPDTTDDLALLTRAFGRSRFVSLWRDDRLAQAVSWSRAEQTGVWFETTESVSERTPKVPTFDRAHIDELLAVIDAHNAAWREWFVKSGIEPHEVRYEDLARDPVGTTEELLAYLGIRLPRGRTIEVRHRRLADRVNRRWIERYREGA